MSFERSYSIESHERIKLILIFGNKSLLLTWWVTYFLSTIPYDFLLAVIKVKKIFFLLLGPIILPGLCNTK